MTVKISAKIGLMAGVLFVMNCCATETLERPDGTWTDREVFYKSSNQTEDATIAQEKKQVTDLKEYAKNTVDTLLDKVKTELIAGTQNESELLSDEFCEKLYRTFLDKGAEQTSLSGYEEEYWARGHWREYKIGERDGWDLKIVVHPSCYDVKTVLGNKGNSVCFELKNIDWLKKWTVKLYAMKEAKGEVSVIEDEDAERVLKLFSRLYLQDNRHMRLEKWQWEAWSEIHKFKGELEFLDFWKNIKDINTKIEYEEIIDRIEYVEKNFDETKSACSRKIKIDSNPTEKENTDENDVAENTNEDFVKNPIIEGMSENDISNDYGIEEEESAKESDPS